MTLGEVESNTFNTYLLTALNLAPATAQKYVYQIKWLHRKLKLFTPKNVSLFVSKLKGEGKSANYLNSMVLACRAWGKYTSNQEFQHLKKFYACRQLIIRGTLSEQEITQILEMKPWKPAQKATWKLFNLIFAVLAYSGMRPAEVERLQVGNLNFGTGCFDLPASITKTRRARSIPIHPFLIPRLQEHIKPLKANDLIFTWTNGHPFTTDKLSEKFRARIRRLGIKRNVSLYSLRHSAGGRILETSNLFVCQKYLGHTNINTTAGYIHLATKDVERAVKRDPLGIPTLTKEERKRLFLEQAQKLAEDFGLEVALDPKRGKLRVE